MCIFYLNNLNLFVTLLFQEKSITTILKDNPYKELSGGPCVKALDETLARCHVQRQAYHGRSFVGNHVNKMLKVIKSRKVYL